MTVTQTIRPFSQSVLDSCISCGYCLPVCPTYQLTGDEASSPRGRINLMKAIQAGEVDVFDRVATEQSDECLGCRACETVCPAGVHYGLLIEQWRDVAWKRKPLKLKGLMTAVKWETPLRIGGRLRGVPRQSTEPSGESFMLGCFERLLYPQMSRMVSELYPNIVVNDKQGCCGALHAHNGDLSQGNRLAESLGRSLDDSIVTTSGGCAAHVASVIGRDRVTEISEYIASQPPAGMRPISRGGRMARIAIQDSCHLRNGLGVASTIRSVVRQLGHLVEMSSSGSCCGAAGSYSLLRPKDARAVFERKHQEISDADLDIIVVVNPGCLRQVKTEVKRHRHPVQVKHLIELVHESVFQA